MNREPPPVFRFKGLVKTEAGPLCAFVIGYAAAPDQAWDVVAVNEVFLRKWQWELDDAREALRKEEEEWPSPSIQLSR